MSGSVAAVQRQLAFSQSLLRHDSGIQVVADVANPLLWHVQMSNFQDIDRAHAAAGRDLDQSLDRHRAKFGTDGKVHLTVTFPEDFPEKPPRVRVVRPVFVRRTGSIDGGALVSPMVFDEGWETTTNMAELLGVLKADIVAANGMVDERHCNPYPQEGGDAVWWRMNQRKGCHKLAGVPEFERDTFFLVSHSWAALNVADSFRSPPDFESSNKVIFPGPIVHKLNSLIAGEVKLTFQLTLHHGVRAYCGMVNQHNLPKDQLLDGQLIICPDWYLAACHAPNFVEVQVEQVSLPQLHEIQVLPLSNDFAGLPDPQSYLQYALQPYASLSIGETIQLSADGKDFSIIITNMQPRAPAATPWTGEHGCEIKCDPLAPIDSPTRRAAPTGQFFGQGGQAANGRQVAAWGAPSGGSAAAAAGAGGDDDDDDEVDGAPGSAPGSPGAVPGAAHAAAVEEANEKFERWFHAEEREQDARASRLSSQGVAIPEWDSADAGAPTRIRVRLMQTPMSIKEFPADITIKCGSDTPMSVVYAFLRDFSPEGAPFVLHRPADPDTIIEDDGATTVGEAGLSRSTLQQRLASGTVCHACEAEQQEQLAAEAAAAAADESAMLDDSPMLSPGAGTDDLELRRELRTKQAEVRRLKEALSAGRFQTYQCEQCTFENPWSNRLCDMCRTARPSAEALQVKLVTQMAQLEEEIGALQLSLQSAAQERQRLQLVRSDSAGADLGSPPPAEAPDNLRTHIVYGGTVTLCPNHRCKWLEDLEQSPALCKCDLQRISRKFVLSSLRADLV